MRFVSSRSVSLNDEIKESLHRNGLAVDECIKSIPKFLTYIMDWGSKHNLLLILLPIDDIYIESLACFLDGCKYLVES
jgi:hypothetical protein